MYILVNYVSILVSIVNSLSEQSYKSFIIKNDSFSVRKNYRFEKTKTLIVMRMYNVKDHYNHNDEDNYIIRKQYSRFNTK